MPRLAIILFVELSLSVIGVFCKDVCIMAHLERSDKTIIWSWLFLHRDALPDQKNLLCEALDIVTVFHYWVTSDMALRRVLK